MNIDAPISNFWQLPTAIIMMLAGGVCLYLNISPWKEPVWKAGDEVWVTFVRDSGKRAADTRGFEFKKTDNEALVYGWPFTTLVADVPLNKDDPDYLIKGTPLNIWMVVLNGIFAAMILAAVAFICEWLVRRKERLRTGHA